MSRSVELVFEHYAPKIRIIDQAANIELSNFIKTTGKVSDKTFPALVTKNQAIANGLSGKKSSQAFSINDRRSLRTDMYLISTAIGKLNKQNKFTDPNEKKTLVGYQISLDKETNYIPNFVKIIVAFALGIGTMIGWKRIVVTVGEKIGKEHFSYGQGASAELVAMATIEAADQFGLPVSTTHVLSSGVTKI